MNLSVLTSAEREQLREALNLTEEENEIYTMLCKGKSIVEIAYKTRMSRSSINRRIKQIKAKMSRI